MGRVAAMVASWLGACLFGGVVGQVVADLFLFQSLSLAQILTGNTAGLGELLWGTFVFGTAAAVLTAPAFFYKPKSNRGIMLLGALVAFIVSASFLMFVFSVITSK